MKHDRHMIKDSNPSAGFIQSAFLVERAPAFRARSRIYAMRDSRPILSSQRETFRRLLNGRTGWQNDTGDRTQELLSRFNPAIKPHDIRPSSCVSLENRPMWRSLPEIPVGRTFFDAGVLYERAQINYNENKQKKKKKRKWREGEEKQRYFQAKR